MHVILDQLVQPAIIGVAGFIAWFLKGLGETVRELNAKMGVYVEKVTTIAEHLEDHEDRLRKLESSDSTTFN